MSAVTDPLHKIEEATRSIARRRCCSEVRGDASDVSRIMSAPTVAQTHTHMLCVSVCVSLSLVYRPFAHSWQHLIIEKEATIRQFAQFASLHLPLSLLPFCPLCCSAWLCLVAYRAVCLVDADAASRLSRRGLSKCLSINLRMCRVSCASLSLSLSRSLTRLADAITRWGTLSSSLRNCMLHVKGEI